MDTLPMSFTALNLLIAVVFFVGMLVVQDAGRRIGMRDQEAAKGKDRPSHGAVEGAVFALLGLFLAFTFSGAGSRFESRRHLIVEEVNAIGTAWLRIDLLPEASQPAMRALFRDYLGARLDSYRLVPDMAAVEVANARAMDLQQQIWSGSVAGARASGQMQAFTVLLPALNDMIDITTTRTAAAGLHPPAIVFVMIALLALAGALFAGYAQAGAASLSRIHRVGFAAVMTIALFLIIDLEYPRLGFIRVDAADQMLVDLQKSMK